MVEPFGDDLDERRLRRLPERTRAAIVPRLPSPALIGLYVGPLIAVCFRRV